MISSIEDQSNPWRGVSAKQGDQIDICVHVRDDSNPVGHTPIWITVGYGGPHPLRI